MNDSAELEHISGIRIISTVPLSKSAEAVKASLDDIRALPAKGPTVAEQVAKTRREVGEYLGIYTNLQSRLATLRKEERGIAGKTPPSGRARGGADAIDGILAALLPLVEGTARDSHASVMRKEIGRLRDAARVKANAGDVVSLGAFYEYDGFLKMV